MRRLAGAAVVAALVLAVLSGWSAPYDDDGEADTLAPVAVQSRYARPVVVDTDLAGDDLIALALLLRHPAVRVEAVTIAATGLVGCDVGADLVAGVFRATGELPVPVACGRETPGPGSHVWPQQWREVAESGSGIAPGKGELSSVPADRLIARTARRVDGLVVVALGPLTNLADVARTSPRAYARLAGIHAMGGSVDGPAVDGIAEWNVAADPQATATVLAGRTPVTVVPEDAIPTGTPLGGDAPLVGLVDARVGYDKWWDTSTAAAYVIGDAGKVESGRWVLDPAEPGRLVRRGPGHVVVYRSLDHDRLEGVYEDVFAAR